MWCEEFKLIATVEDGVAELSGPSLDYTVKRGQTVGEGVKVEAIFKDHVVLSYEGQEFELR